MSLGSLLWFAEEASAVVDTEPYSRESWSTRVPADGETQDEYAVVLIDPGAKKVQVIKVVRAATELNLREAKDLVDGSPNVVKEGLSRIDADALKTELEKAGATVELW